MQSQERGGLFPSSKGGRGRSCPLEGPAGQELSEGLKSRVSSVIQTVKARHGSGNILQAVDLTA